MRCTAGGEKYIIGGMFFKFARDWAGLYGGDSFAAKAASLELTNLRQFLRLARGAAAGRLSLPLTLLADYGGYRIVASALLPISGAQTLVYGSAGEWCGIGAGRSLNACCSYFSLLVLELTPQSPSADAGATVHDDDSEAARRMAAAATAINVKPHVVGNGAGAKLMHGPCDIEVHRGSDGRYYVVDAARLMPPEPPAGSLSAFLIHAASPGSAAGATEAKHGAAAPTTAQRQHMTAVDLSRDGAEAEIALVLSSAAALGAEAAANVGAPGAVSLLRVDIPGATLYIRADANPHRAAARRSPPGAAPRPHDFASMEAIFGRNAIAEAFLASTDQLGGGSGASAAVYGDALIVAGERGQHLFHCLRPELVRDWPVPLSSDAFTRFGRHDAETHNAEVLAATRALQQTRLPALSGYLCSNQRLPLSPRSLVEQVGGGAYKVQGVLVQQLGGEWRPCCCTREVPNSTLPRVVRCT